MFDQSAAVAVAVRIIAEQFAGWSLEFLTGWLIVVLVSIVQLLRWGYFVMKNAVQLHQWASALLIPDSFSLSPRSLSFLNSAPLLFRHIFAASSFVLLLPKLWRSIFAIMMDRLHDSLELQHLAWPFPFELFDIFHSWFEHPYWWTVLLGHNYWNPVSRNLLDFFS